MSSPLPVCLKKEPPVTFTEAFLWGALPGWCGYSVATNTGKITAMDQNFGHKWLGVNSVSEASDFTWKPTHLPRAEIGKLFKERKVGSLLSLVLYPQEKPALCTFKMKPNHFGRLLGPVATASWVSLSPHMLAATRSSLLLSSGVYLCHRSNDSEEGRRIKAIVGSNLAVLGGMDYLCTVESLLLPTRPSIRLAKMIQDDLIRNDTARSFAISQASSGLGPAMTTVARTALRGVAPIAPLALASIAADLAERKNSKERIAS